MGGTGSRIAVGLAVIAAAFAVTANAHATSIVASPTCCTFEPGPFVQGLGETASFDNTQSQAAHDVASTQPGPDGQPLFFSEAILGGQTTPVMGTQYLDAGTYPFFCTIHGAGMSGQLTIDGASGTVVPRPSVKVTLVRQKLKQLRRKGVRVKIKAAAASSPVMIVATRGKTIVGQKRGLGLGAGQVRTMTLPLTKAGRKAVRKGKVVKLKVRATVPFGKPSVSTGKIK